MKGEEYVAKTILEALAEFSEKPYIGDDKGYEEIVINDELREIYIPDSERLFGVESDEKAERKHFRCPRYVGDNIDLTTLSLRINYRNANDETDQYIVMDTAIEERNEEEIVFSWLLSRKVTKYKGMIQFIVCAVKSEDGKIKNEWNTTLATAEVLEGLEAEIVVTPDEVDVLQQLVNLATESANKAQEATETASNVLKEAEMLKQNLQSLVQQAEAVIKKIEELETNAFTENTPIQFTPSEILENIESGDSLKTMAGKVQSVFDSFGEAAQYDVANSFDDIGGTIPQVPDAGLVKTLNERGYEELTGKPKINNVELTGNKSLEDIGVLKAITDILNDGAKIKYLPLDDVSSLPEVGEEGIIYLVPPVENMAESGLVILNKFDEYMYVIDHYEIIGQVSAEQLVADAELSITSENPVQNKVITKKIGEIETETESINTVLSAQGEAITNLDNKTQESENNINNNVWNFKEYIEIPEGADLNDYKTVGNYACSGNIKSGTIINNPSLNAFVLKVENSVSQASNVLYLRQTVLNYNGENAYTRSFMYDGTHDNVWSDWVSLTMFEKRIFEQNSTDEHVKSWYNGLPYGVRFMYNTSGNEWSYIAFKRKEGGGNYGSILRINSHSPEIQIMNNKNGVLGNWYKLDLRHVNGLVKLRSVSNSESIEDNTIKSIMLSKYTEMKNAGIIDNTKSYCINYHFVWEEKTHCYGTYYIDLTDTPTWICTLYIIGRAYMLYGNETQVASMIHLGGGIAYEEISMDVNTGGTYIPGITGMNWIPVILRASQDYSGLSVYGVNSQGKWIVKTNVNQNITVRMYKTN